MTKAWGIIIAATVAALLLNNSTAKLTALAIGFSGATYGAHTAWKKM